MRTCFGMNGDDIGTRFGKIAHIGIDGRDHQMHIENLGAVRAQGFNDSRANRQIRYEMPVHHIDMNIIRARCINRADLLPQFGKVCGKNRGRNADHGFLWGLEKDEPSLT